MTAAEKAKLTKLARKLLEAHLEAILPAWTPLRTNVVGVSKVSTWATRELAQSVADAYVKDGRQARVFDHKGRYGVEIWC